MEKIKILYVGYEAIGDLSATGNTLYNIFKATSHLTVLHASIDYSENHHISHTPCYYISEQKSAIFCFLKKYYRDRVAHNNSEILVANNKKSRPVTLLAKAILDILPKRWDNSTIHKIDEFEPQVIYTLVESISTLRKALFFSKRYNIPIVMHIMDDIDATLYRSSFLTLGVRYMYMALLNRAYQRSVINIAIGEKMATEFAERHKTPFEVAMNCLDTLHAQPQPNNTPMRLVFSGGLHGGRAQSLALMADIIAKSPKLSGSAKLIVYTSPQNRVAYQSMLVDRGVEVYDYVPKSEMFANLGKADVLIHVESFMPEEIEYFKYSMSTKIPEYMSVGRPIVCFGPREICTVDYIARKQVGMVASNENELIEVLSRVIVDAKLRQDLSNRALRVAEKEHLASAVGERVERVFATAIKNQNRAR